MMVLDIRDVRLHGNSVCLMEGETKEICSLTRGLLAIRKRLDCTVTDHQEWHKCVLTDTAC